LEKKNCNPGCAQAGDGEFSFKRGDFMQADVSQTAIAPIRIGMFGGFSITVGDVVIKDSTARSFQLWNFLEYLITFRNKTISQEELMRALWEDNDIENPASALKNLAYRMRTVFSNNGIPMAKQIITFSKGGYQWNNSLDCTVDIEEFERCHKKAANTSNAVDYRIEKYMQAIELYKGDFLPSSGYRSWVVPVSSYYRSMYFKCVYEALRLLVDMERYAEVEMICNRALIVDQFEENAHKYLMLAYIKQGQQNKAISHYRFITDLFLHELGVNPSSSLRNLYRQLAKTTHSVEIDIGIIQQDLKEAECADGAFYCEYEVFKNIYQVQARAAPRNGQQIFVCLLTVIDASGTVPDEELRKRAMDGLFRVIQNSTRSCDVFARFSATQYVLILPTTSKENCAMVMERISKQYKKEYKVKSVEVHFKIQPIDPAEII